MSRELRATYRLQLHADFGLDAAAALTDYLAELGISHLYCSPVLQAAPRSRHGYDVVDPRRVNEELGGAEALVRLHEAVAAHDLGALLDIVPNHMAIDGRENAWWWDVLENGPSSRFAGYFDVDWDPPEAKLRNVVLLPILGEHYGRVLAAGEIQVARHEGTLTVHHEETVLPVAPRSLDVIVASAAQEYASEELSFLADSFGQLPLATATDRASVERRHRDKEVLATLLRDLCRRDPHAAEAIDAVIARINADPQALDGLLERQNYRLTYWRAAARELDYRRFFDINNLVGVRVEDERVFEATHALVLGWLADGVFDGVRVDHVDGLYDPTMYLQRLRERAPEAWIGVEKILARGERLPAAWPIAGTTGYDFLTLAGGLFVDPTAEQALTDFYADFSGEPTDYATLEREKKLVVLREALGSDLNRLTALWLDICQHTWRYRDYTRHDLQQALGEVIANFPVYRTYVQPETGTVRDDDQRVIAETLDKARMRRADLDPDLFTFLADLLLLRIRGRQEAEFVMRFQQLTGPAMAKGAEDTAFYCFNRLTSLNDVGGDPGHFGTTIEAFHSACAATQVHWPRTLLATSTHDTKRSEDVRARISLLTEVPDAWSEAVRRWSEHNAVLRRNDLPDRNAEYLLYQTLVGAWPLTAKRARTYMKKAAREAKVYTSWTAPDAEYEQALRSFVEGVLADEEFLTDLAQFVEPLVTPGWINSLAQVLLKLTAPGVPDLYQGTELWDLSLVDPDNRRAVDYDLRRRLLKELDSLACDEIWARRDEGLPKLWVIRQALRLRERHPERFGARSSYQPLTVQGAKAQHAVAFARGGGVVTVVPRLVIGRGDDWGDTTVELPPGHWHNELTGERIAGGSATLSELLHRFPVALLAREEGTV